MPAEPDVSSTDSPPAPGGASEQVPRASPSDSARLLAQVLLPVVARGAITRRPRVVSLVQGVDGDARAVRLMQRVRDTYGPGPVQVVLPGRRLTFVLDADDVHTILDGAPEPFRPDTTEKRHALGHFQPEGVLASTPEQREHRRPFNAEVLDAGRTLHRVVGPASAVVAQEVEVMLQQLEHDALLDWDRFSTTWWRIVRRVVLGDSARDDDTSTNLLLQLRQDGNWSYLRPRRTQVRERFLAGLRSRLAAAAPGSLAAVAAVAAGTATHPDTVPEQQVPQWLFAFDAAAWATFRALALVAGHPEAARTLREELPRAPDLPYGRATVLESLRLWPTTPAILRETHVDTELHGRVLPAGASIVIFAPFFHRDETRLPEAHRFAPELWLRERTSADHPLVPFSGGPAMCPGRNLTLLVASQVLACTSAAQDFRLEGARLDPAERMPGTLDPFALRFVPQD